MPSKAKPQTSETGLGALLEKLCEAQVEFILVGGLAAVVQGAPVTTLDVDIVHSRAPDNISRLMSVLKSLDAIYRRPDDKIIEPTQTDLSGMGHLLLSTRLGPLDILSFIEERKTYEDLIDHTEKIPFRGHILQVLGLKTMVELKRASSDPGDRQRLRILEETLRQLTKKRP